MHSLSISILTHYFEYYLANIALITDYYLSDYEKLSQIKY